MGEALLSAVVVTYNSKDDIVSCLEALQAADWPRLEVIVVDNGSADGTAEVVARAFPAVHLVRSGANLGFGGGANLGFAYAQGDILLVLNPDVRLRPDALAAFAAAFACDEHVGVVGAKLLYPDGHTVQHAGGIVDYPLATTRHRGYGEADNGQYDQATDVPFVTGAALALRRPVIEATGGFDAGFYPVYYEDVDLCYRARAAGWRVVYWPQAVGVHRESVSLDRQGELYYRYLHANRVRFVLKHYSTRQIVQDFLPAEGRRLQAAMPTADRRASRLAYRSQESTMSDELTAVVAELDGRWLVREKPFASRVPVLGRFIAGFRTLWNNVATRWYVQPLLQQQVEYNAAVLRAVQALARHVGAQETLLAASQAMLGKRLLDVEERVTRLEKRTGESA